MVDGVTSLLNSDTGRAVQDGVRSALRQAASRTGVKFDVLYKIAERESAFDATAKAATSSAAGLFQFIEQTWLGVVKSHGAKHGLADYAADIERGANGRLSVENAERKTQILDLRFDAATASALAGELITENKNALEARLNRPVSGGELYAAHFLGVAGAAKLLSAPKDAIAAELFPAAAKSNAPVFYKGGAAKTVSDLVDSFNVTMGTVSDNAPLAATERIQGGAQAAENTSVARSTSADTRRNEEAAPGLSLTRSQTRSFTVEQTLERALDGLQQRLSTSALSALQSLDPTLLRRDRDG